MDRRNSALQLGNNGRGAAGVVFGILRHGNSVILVGIEQTQRLVQGLGELFGVAQQIPPGNQAVLLPCLQLRPLQLRDLIAQALAEPRLLHLVHAELIQLLAQSSILPIFCLIGVYFLLQLAEAVQIAHVPPLVHQLPAVILSVNVHKQRSQLLHLRRRNRRAADTAAALAVGVDPTLQDQLLIGVDLIIPQPGFRIGAVKDRRHQRLFRPTTHKLPADSLTENRTDSVDHDGFTRAGLAGENVQPALKADIRPFDHRDILNMQFVEHTSASLSVKSASRKRSHKSSSAPDPP